MARQPSNPTRPKDVGRERSGHRAEYTKVNGLTRTVYRCPCHGQEFQTRIILNMHTKQYRARLRKDFAGIVKDGNLGQDAWARLPGETSLNFSRFQIYLRQPTDRRSVETVAKIVGRKYQIMSKISAEWSWRLRAEIWDRRVEADALAQFEAEKRGSARKQAKLGRKLQEVALQGAMKLLTNEERLDEMSGNEIAKLADVGTKIERLANSDPTSITDDRGKISLVWEGPKPTWAPQHEPVTIDASPLTQKVLEAGND